MASKLEAIKREEFLDLNKDFDGTDDAPGFNRDFEVKVKTDHGDFVNHALIQCKIILW